jgi:hypothetical protein
MNIDTRRARLRPCRRRRGHPLSRCIDDGPQAHASRRAQAAAVLRAGLQAAGDAAPPMIPMLLILALFLASSPRRRALSPEAGEHNTKAMRFYDAGQFAPAVDEFYAAYQAMPDARRDRAGRELLLGSMRRRSSPSTTRPARPRRCAACRKFLKEHADALTAAFPDDPDMLETRSARARHEEVTQQLAAFGPDACAAATSARAAAVPVDRTRPRLRPTPPKAATTAQPGHDPAAPPQDRRRRHPRAQRRVLLGVMTYGIATEGQARASAAEIRRSGRRLPAHADRSSPTCRTSAATRSRAAPSPSAPASPRA